MRYLALMFMVVQVSISFLLKVISSDGDHPIMREQFRFQSILVGKLLNMFNNQIDTKTYIYKVI